MSAEANLVFFGIRFELDEEEAEARDIRRHPLIAQAREKNLDYYMGNFGGCDPRYFLFIGKKIGLTGAENETELILDADQICNVIEDMRKKLGEGSFEGAPKLYINWIADS